MESTDARPSWEELLRPIPGADPAGPWLRREGVYESLRESMKEEPPDESGRPGRVADWNAVRELAAETLRDRSKDLYVAVCLTQALGRLKRYAGLAEGLAVVANLHARFWDGFWPRPRENDLDARVNQIVKLRGDFPGWIRRVPLTDGRKPLDWFDWKHAGGASRGGDPWPVSREEFEEGVAATARERLNEDALACKAILAQADALAAVIRDRYGKSAPSIAEVKESATEVLDALERMLRDKGGYLPAPGEEEATRILEATGCSLVEQGWLAEWVRKGLAEALLTDSLACAAHDHGKRGAPKEGWPARLAARFAKGEAYRAEAPGYAKDAAAGTAPAAPGPAPTAAGRRAEAPRGEPRETLLACAHALRRATPSSPLPYLVVRAVRWSDLRARGAELVPGSLPGPGAATRKKLADLFEKEKWKELLDASEEFHDRPEASGWLDLQRYSMASMRYLGADFAAPRRAVAGALADLLRDAPVLLEGSLADRSPAADETTRNWIRAEILLKAAPAAEGGGPAAANGSSEALAEATRLAKDGKIADALGVLDRERNRAPSARERFLRRLEMAELCLDAKQTDLGVSLLEDLEGEADRRGLEGWESSEFCARLFANLLRGYRTQGSNDGARRSLARLARVDISRVMPRS